MLSSLRRAVVATSKRLSHIESEPTTNSVASMQLPSVHPIPANRERSASPAISITATTQSDAAAPPIAPAAISAARLCVLRRANTDATPAASVEVSIMKDSVPSGTVPLPLAINPSATARSPLWASATRGQTRSAVSMIAINAGVMRKSSVLHSSARSIVSTVNTTRMIMRFVS